MVGGGSGGGGGAGDGSNAGGVGGQGAGVAGIFARIFVNNGTISANGAPGFPGSAGNAAGGGGGGGGFVQLVASTYSGSFVLGTSVLVNGAVGGAGSGTGATGTTGSAGTFYQLTQGGSGSGPQGATGATGAAVSPALSAAMTLGLACPPGTTTQITPTPTITFTPTGTTALVIADFSGLADPGTTEVLFSFVAGAAQKVVPVGGVTFVGGLSAQTWISASATLLLTGLVPGNPITIVTSLTPEGGVGGATTASEPNAGNTTVIDLG